MTQKTANLVAKYEEKILTEYFLYEKGYICFEELQKNTRNRCKEFELMLSGMFTYHLISQKDHEELCCVPWHIRDKIIDKAIAGLTSR